MHRGRAIELAPLYDVVSTVAYPELDPAFAMSVGARATLEELRVGDWDRFAGSAGLSAPFVRRRVAELAECALGCTESVAAELSQPGLSDQALAACADRVSGASAAAGDHGVGFRGILRSVTAVT